MESVFKETIGKRLEDKIEVDYAFQDKEDIPSKQYLVEKREKPWGTVQAVLSAKNHVSGDFVVINADDFYGADAYKQASEFLDQVKDENGHWIDDVIRHVIKCKVSCEGTTNEQYL